MNEAMQPKITVLIPGIILGSKLSGRVPESVLRFTLAAVLAVVGGRMLFS